MLPFAMTNDEDLCTRAHSQHQEALLSGRVIFIEELNAKFVKKYRFRFLKRHLMFFEICNGFWLIPFECNHTYIVFMDRYESSRKKMLPFNAEGRANVLVDAVAHWGPMLA